MRVESVECRCEGVRFRVEGVAPDERMTEVCFLTRSDMFYRVVGPNGRCAVPVSGLVQHHVWDAVATEVLGV